MVFKFKNITQFFFRLWLLVVFAAKISYAQNTGEKKITLTSDATIGQVLSILSAKYQLHFSYSSDKIPLKKKIKLSVVDETLENTLKKIFEGTTVSYKINGNNVVLYPDVKNKKVTLSGYIKENGSSELLPGVNVYQTQSYSGTASNNYGFYSISLPADTQEVVYSYVGYVPVKKKIYLDKDTELNIILSPSIDLDPVEVLTERKEFMVQTTGIDYAITTDDIKNTPSLLGEKDVLRTLQLSPGFTRENEISNGYFVRGGGNGQNLIILDDAPIYNAFHLFGLFSIFNGDALKNMQVIKGGFPARYGGRVSSVIDVSTKEGNKESVHGDASIGILSSRLSLEGPIIKNKLSWFISGRRTYLDPVVNSMLNKSDRLRYTFFDVNGKINYEINKNNKVYFSSYIGKDIFKQGESAILNTGGIEWGNRTSSLRLNHLYNNKLFSNTSFIFSYYKFEASDKQDSARASSESGIRDYTFKHDFDYFLSNNHYLKFGTQITLHEFTPSKINISDTTNRLVFSEIYKGSETSFYVEDEIKFSSKIRANAGMRFSLYNTDGSKMVMYPEPRLSLAYDPFEKFTVRVSYMKVSQFVHLLSSTSIGLPSDMWVPSTDQIKPETGDQYTLGVFKHYKNFSFSAEGYYKSINHILAYKEGLSVLDIIYGVTERDNIQWENNTTEGRGWAYGSEFMIKKNSGKIRGTACYTISWAEQQFDAINKGKKFWASYDRRHVITFLGIWDITPRFSASVSWNYSTGTAFTLQKSEYIIHGHAPGSYYGNTYFLTEYGDKNSYRTSPYHRMDIAFNYHRKRKRYESSFEFGVFNVYNRKNVLFYTQSYDEEKNHYVLKKQSLFGLTPSVSYSIKF
jgi:hypothetical protein